VRSSFGPTSIRHRSTAFVRRTRLPEGLGTATAHPARQPPRKNDVDCYPVDPSHSRSRFCCSIRTLRDVPHEVGQWIPSLREFLTDSECTIEIKPTHVSSATGGSTPNPHGGRNEGTHGQRNSGDQPLPAFLQVECLSDICTAEGSTTDPGLKHSHQKSPTEHDQGPRQGLPGKARGQCGDGLRTIHTRFHEQPACQILGPWTRPDLRTWLLLMILPQMLLPDVTQYSAATIGTSSNVLDVPSNGD
jgi:hypothetical protein